MITTHKRKTAQPTSSSWIRSCPGVTISLNVAPSRAEDEPSSPPDGCCSKIEHNGYDMEVKVLNIDCDIYAARILSRGTSASSSRCISRSTSFSGKGKLFENVSRMNRRRSHYNGVDFTPDIAPANGPYSSPEDADSKLGANGLTHRDAVDLILKNGLSLCKPTPGICQICSSRKTGQWRRGPHGPRTLCNVSTR
jgi:hypothetical protein